MRGVIVAVACAFGCHKTADISTPPPLASKQLDDTIRKLAPDCTTQDSVLECSGPAARIQRSVRGDRLSSLQVHLHTERIEEARAKVSSLVGNLVSQAVLDTLMQHLEDTFPKSRAGESDAHDVGDVMVEARHVLPDEPDVHDGFIANVFWHHD